MINNNGPLAVQAILKTIHETEGMHENDAFKLDTKIGIRCSCPTTPRKARWRSRRSAPPNFQMKRALRPPGASNR